MPMLFSPTIGAAITARHWFLWVRCPACRTTQSVDLRSLDRHHEAAVTSLIRSYRAAYVGLMLRSPNCYTLSKTSIAHEIYLERSRRTRGHT
jgi:hypothetical protein